METKIKASNIKCSGCVNSISNQLMKVEEIKAVIVDIPSNEITIEYESAVNVNTVRKKLAEIGYPERQELIN